MSYKALYRTYRPQTFDEMTGQRHILKTLKNAINEDKIAHAYLFTGPRGTGKTSMAKLLAKALNCDKGTELCNECENCKEITNGSHPDVIEIDAASNNGVDEVRELIDKVKYLPILGKYKVYIIDEVHMMTSGAFNALLKTLEEPPAHVVFILATTEPHKVIPTIMSRCQRFDFGRISNKDIKSRIKVIVEKENIRYEEEVIDLIAELSDGGMRDALSILDQTIAYAQNDIKCQHVREIYGVTSMQEKIILLNLISEGKSEEILAKINDYDDKGVDLARLSMEMIDLLKEVIVFRNSGSKAVLKPSLLTKITEVKEEDNDKLFAWIDILVETLTNFKKVNAPKSFFELGCLKMAKYKSAMMAKREMYLNKTPSTSSDAAKKENENIEEKQQNTVEFEEQNVEKNEPEKEIIMSDDRKEETVKTEIVSHETQEKEETKESEDRVIPAEEELLNVLVQATKDDLIIAKQKWIILPRYMNSNNTARVTGMLLEGLPVAACRGVIILAYENETYLNRVNTKTDNTMMNNFLKALYNENMICYCLTKEDFLSIKDRYMELRKINELPPPKPIVFDDEEQTKDETLELGVKIFGDFLKIKEEE